MSSPLNEHQRQVLKGMFVKPGVDKLAHAALGLAGETGEVVDCIKKGQYEGREIDILKLRDECGDVLWYFQYILGHFGWTLEELAMENVEKLAKRYPGRYDLEAMDDAWHDERTR